ncbi:MAG: outer membrane protein assembly factor BamD, partial [Bacteriovoracaceae bacterium]
MNKFIALFLFASLFLASCSSTRPSGKTEAEVLYKEAQMLVDDGRYLMATEKLNSLRSQFPYSYFATHAELLQADILFDQENFVEAAAAYILFKDFHPRHKKISYVVWRIAESFNNQRPASYDRDLSPLYEAIK